MKGFSKQVFSIEGGSFIRGSSSTVLTLVLLEKSLFLS